MATSLGPIDKRYMSAIDVDFPTKEINPNLIDIQGTTRLSSILAAAGRTVPTKQPFFITFANTGVFKQIDTTASTVTGSGTATVTVTGITAATSGYNRINDLLLIVATNKVVSISSVVTTAGQDTLILKSVDQTNITLVAGNILNSFSLAVGERSDSPLNLRYPPTKILGKTQAFREVSQITDIENMSTISVTVNGSNKYIVLDHLQKVAKLEGNINAALWGGEMSTTSYADTTPWLVDNNAPTNGGGGGAEQTTRGVDKWIENSGVVLAAGALGTVAAADNIAVQAALTANRAPDEYIVYGGKAALATNDAYWKNLGSGGVTSIRMEIGGRDVDTNVQMVSSGGYVWNYVSLPILNNPSIFGGSIISKSLYFIPKDGMVTTADGGMQPAMQIRYQPQLSNYVQANTNGMIGEIQSGALNTVNPTGSVAEMKTEWITYQGLEALAAPWMARLRVLA